MAEFDALIGELPALARFRGHLADKAATLEDWFAASGQIEMCAGNLSDMLRYAVIGVWLGVGALWVFVMARLAKQD